MPWNDQLTRLNQILADLYPRRSQSERIVDMAGIPPGNIAFKDAAMDNWYYILKEANRRSRVEELVQVVVNQYPEQEELKNLFRRATDHDPVQPVEMTYLANLRSLLGEGETGQAIEELKRLGQAIPGHFHNDVIHQAGRYHRIRKDHQIGVVTYNQYILEINRINAALLSLIDDIPKETQVRASRQVVGDEDAGLATPSLEDLEKVIGREELFEINWLQKALKASRSVCKVLRPDGLSGTGFILNGGYLLTNHHVLENGDIAGRAKIIFNYQLDDEGRGRPTQEYGLDTSVFASSPFDQLDYTLVKVRAEEEDLVRWGHLELETFLEPEQGQRVNIIQHPEGKTMKLALPDKIISRWKQYLFYVADTKPGSSGSPVFNQDWKVVALHHAGKNEQSAGGGMRINEAGEVKPANRGVLIKPILEHIRQAGYGEVTDGF